MVHIPKDDDADNFYFLPVQENTLVQLASALVYWEYSDEKLKNEWEYWVGHIDREEKRKK